MQVADIRIAHYAIDFYRMRRVLKFRANLVVWVTAAGTGVSTILGAIEAIVDHSVFGVFVAAVGAIVSTIVAWDRLFDHRKLWIQRTRVLHEIQALRNEYEMKKARGKSSNSLARATTARLDAILDRDFLTWNSLREQGSKLLQR